MQIEEYKTKLEKTTPDGVKLEINKDTLIVNINSKDKSTNMFYLLDNDDIAKIPCGINNIIIETNDTVNIPAKVLHKDMCIKVKGNLEIVGDLKLFGNENINFIVSGNLIVTSSMFPTHFDAIIGGDFHLIAPVLPSGVFLRVGGSLFLPVTQFLPTLFGCIIGGDLYLTGFEGRLPDLMMQEIILGKEKKIFLRNNINKELGASSIEEKKEMMTYTNGDFGRKYHVCFMDDSKSVNIPDQGILIRWIDKKSKETYIKAIFNSGESLFGKLEGKEGNEKVCMYTISPLSSYANPIKEFLVTYSVNYDGINEIYEMYNTCDYKEAMKKQEEYMKLAKDMDDLAPCCECTPNCKCTPTKM